MISDPFPEIRTRVELDALPPGTFVECVSCVDHECVIADVDPHEWATDHQKLHPSHVRFRTVSMSNFRVVPAGIVGSTS